MLAGDSYGLLGYRRFPITSIMFIQSMKTGVVTLTVRSGNGKLPRGTTIKRSPSVRGTEFEVTLVKEANKPLGLQLTDLKKDAHHVAVFVKKIAPNSPADRCTELQ